MDAKMKPITTFSFEEKALSVHETRAALLTQNISNSNTPNYKSKDIDFRDALKQNQDFAQLLGLNTAIPYKEHATKLKPGDLVMVYTKGSHEFCHIAFFRSHASQKTTEKPPRVIELGGNSETSHVRKGQIQITDEFELYVKPLKDIFKKQSIH